MHTRLSIEPAEINTLYFEQNACAEPRVLWKLGAIFIESSKYHATLQSLAHEHASAKQAFLHHAAVVWPAFAHRSCSPYREKHCLLTYFLE